MSAKILDSANPTEIKSLTEGCVRCSKDERGHSERDEGAQIPSVEIEGICVSKNLDETTRFQSEKRVDMRDQRKVTTRNCRGHE